MTEFTGAWAEPAVESYLAEAAIPIRLACHRPDGSLWLVALWYRYRDGVFECATGANADVVGYLRGDSAVAFEVSENRPPYRGVRGNGTAALSPDADKSVLRDLVERYLGDAGSPLAEWLLSEDREEVRIRIRPDRVHSWDYSDRMAADGA
ncbi:pyridoxamine 5'-phosphate oxidase family protein [Halorussus marinus]|uniref:pyridoxamine 5'-phosphate oxidase family protein n=1 Tax=Halorussus marinus TaxID=2505976 RepID=UPI00106DE517|nr:pyridoxamine 5'-phosphate oxidase family protein [Halorussus marinus]